MDRNNLELLFSKFLVYGKKSFSTEKRRQYVIWRQRVFKIPQEMHNVQISQETHRDLVNIHPEETKEIQIELLTFLRKST